MARFGLGPARIVLVPGNHDVDIGRNGEVMRDSIDGVGGREAVDAILGDPERLAIAETRQTAWNAFHRDFYGSEPPLRPGPLSAVHEYRLDGASVGVAALNSAWLSEGKGDKGRLAIGRLQLRPALRAIAGADIRLVVVHHPLDWLTELDALDVSSELSRRGVVVLSGHLHNPEATARLSPEGEALSLRAGCLYLHPEYPNSYTLIEIDPALRVASVQFQRWHSSREAFDADLSIAPGGQDEFDLPISREARERKHPRFSEVASRIAAAAYELRRET